MGSGIWAGIIDGFGGILQGFLSWAFHFNRCHVLVENYTAFGTWFLNGSERRSILCASDTHRMISSSRPPSTLSTLLRSVIIDEERWDLRDGYASGPYHVYRHAHKRDMYVATQRDTSSKDQGNRVSPQSNGSNRIREGRESHTWLGYNRCSSLGALYLV